MSAEIQGQPATEPATRPQTEPAAAAATAVEEEVLDTSSLVDFDSVELVTEPEMADEIIEVCDPIEVETEAGAAPDTSDDPQGVIMGAVGALGVAGGIALATTGSMLAGVAVIGLSAYLAYRTFTRLTN